MSSGEALADAVRQLIERIDMYQRRCAMLRVEPEINILNMRDNLKAALAQYDATAPAEGSPH
jgi:hypothetical protein